MKKYLKITLISLLTLIIILAGLLFTQTGNDIVKPYLKAELEKQFGQPVDVKLLKLRYDHTALKIVVNHALSIDVQSIFNLLDLSFDGTYTIYANNFVYNTINLREANINGEFKGVPDDLLVNGKGNTFDAPLNYDLHVLNGEAKEITLQLKNMNIADILHLVKQPTLAKGMVDANVTIPTLVKGEMSAHGKINFDGITFNDEIVKKVYKVSMPEAMKMNGTVEANLTDTQVAGSVAMQSNIANVNLDNAHFNTETKYLSSNYILDIVNLKSLSDLLHTKLDGALVLQGEVKKEKTLKVTGSTKSLGGSIHYALADNNFSSSIMAVPAKNMLGIFGFPEVVDAQASGEMGYNLLNKKGNTKLALEEFKLASNKVTKSIGMMILKDPSSIHFGKTSFDATIYGNEINYTLMAKAHDASMTIDKATINLKKDTQEAKIKFAYSKYAVEGSLKGSARHPTIGFDTQGLALAKMPDTDFMTKIGREIKRFFRRVF